ncbi:MAG: tyrosine-type recombinase/integrase [Bacteroidetes bacterium]|nr:tyrosine-type recombinase/integrase [Bacteroidota bacterium]
MPAQTTLQENISTYELVDLCLESVTVEETKRAYQSDLKQFLEFLRASGADLKPAHTLTISHIQSFFDSQQMSHLKQSTLNRRLASLRYFLKWCFTTGFVEDDQSKFFITKPISQKLPESRLLISEEDSKLLIEVARSSTGTDNVRNSTLIEFMLSVPVRRSSLSKMNYEDLDLACDRPFVRIPKSRGATSIFYRLPVGLVTRLKFHTEHYGIASGPLWRSISRRNEGGRLTPTSIYRIVRATALAAGLPEIGAHTLRHTGCTLAIEAGASIQQVQSHARHKQIETTMVYVHQRDRLRDSAADYINLDLKKD